MNPLAPITDLASMALSPLADLPVVGSLFGPSSEQKKRERELQEAIAQSKAMYAQYRPQARGAHLSGLADRAALFGPVNDAIARLYGSDAMFDLSAFGRDPFGATAGPGFTSNRVVNTVGAAPVRGNPGGFVGTAFGPGPSSPRSGPLVPQRDPYGTGRL